MTSQVTASPSLWPDTPVGGDLLVGGVYGSCEQAGSEQQPGFHGISPSGKVIKLLTERQVAVDSARYPLVRSEAGLPSRTIGR